MRLTLTAEECCSVVAMGTFSSFEEAAAFIVAQDDAGAWPEGHDAYATDENDHQYVFTDHWSPA